MWQLCKVRFIFIAEAFALVAAVGCGDQQSGGAVIVPVSAVNLSTMLTEGARLNRSGEIQVAGPVATWLPQITSGRADSLAQGWVHTFASMARSFLERQHGAPINVPALRVCGRTFFARSAFDPLPPTLPGYAQRSFGPYWMVTLCDGQVPAVSLAVSAYATELTLANGQMRFPIFSGEEFKWMGIPVGSAGLPLPPEVAVATMFAQIRRRVAAAPELVIPGHSIPQLARWHLRLDSTASFRTKNGIVRQQDVYVGKRSAGDTVLARLAPAQPDSVTFHWFSPPPRHWIGPGWPRLTGHPASAMRAAGMPTEFEAVFGVLAPSKKH